MLLGFFIYLAVPVSYPFHTCLDMDVIFLHISKPRKHFFLLWWTLYPSLLLPTYPCDTGLYWLQTCMILRSSMIIFHFSDGGFFLCPCLNFIWVIAFIDVHHFCAKSFIWISACFCALRIVICWLSLAKELRL